MWSTQEITAPLYWNMLWLISLLQPLLIFLKEFMPWLQVRFHHDEFCRVCFLLQWCVSCFVLNKSFAGNHILKRQHLMLWSVYKERKCPGLRDDFGDRKGLLEIISPRLLTFHWGNSNPKKFHDQIRSNNSMDSWHRQDSLIHQLFLVLSFRVIEW